MQIAFKLTWTESERGWGTRPDGYSLHLSENHAKKYVDDYWKKMPKDIPDEYSRPDQDVAFPIDISDVIAEELKIKKNLRYWK